MRFVTSLSLQLSQLRPLVVVIAEAEVKGERQLTAYGVDPNQDPNSEEFVFIRQVVDLGEFLSSVVDPEGQMQLVADVPIMPGSIDVPVKPPATPWPLAVVVIALARSVNSDNHLGNSGTTT